MDDHSIEPKETVSASAKLGKKALTLKQAKASLALPESEKHLLYTGLEDFLEGFFLK